MEGEDYLMPYINCVPLLLLFTAHSATREMLRILQDYGEVICCYGSAVNIENTGVFLQADCGFDLHSEYSLYLFCNYVDQF